MAVDTVLFFAVLFLPWWGCSLVALFGLWRFPNFWEIAFAAFFFDALAASGYPFFLSSLALFLFAKIIRSRVRG